MCQVLSGRDRTPAPPKPPHAAREQRKIFACRFRFTSIHPSVPLPPPRFHHTLPPTHHHPSLLEPSTITTPTAERAINISAISKIPIMSYRRHDSI